MKKTIYLILLCFLFSTSEILSEKKESKEKGARVMLSQPKFKSSTSIEEALLKRRSIRDYKKGRISKDEASQILWSAQGKTANWGGRTAPSAGATYPLEVYLVAGEVEGLEKGVYHYNAEEHSLTLKLSSDIRRDLANAALGQHYILKAPASIVITAVYERTTSRYGERGIRYVHNEVGHVGQNIHLQCESLQLGTVVIGAFSDKEVKKVLQLPPEEEPIYIMPVGRK